MFKNGNGLYNIFKRCRFTKKTEKFYKNNKILFILNKILNLPTNTIKLVEILKANLF